MIMVAFCLEFGDLNSLHCPLSFGVMAAGKNKKTPRSMMEIG